MKLTIKIILFSIAGIAACKKVIHVNLNNAAPQTVIQGEITNAPGPYQVSIVQTVNFEADNVFPPVSGATVQVTDNTSSQTDLLTETTPGIYTTHTLQGIPGHTYQLSVTAAGKSYTASSTMPQPIPLDSVSFLSSNVFNNNRINAVANFQDPPGLGNYYQFTENVKGRQINNIFIFEDRLSDGKYIRRRLGNDSSYINKGDSVLIKMYCLDKATYDYFNTLDHATGNGFDATAPANPVTNISNGGLGFFSAHTTTSKKVAAK